MNEPMFATELVPNYIVERARSGLIEECNREELLTIEPLQGLSLLRWGPRIGRGGGGMAMLNTSLNGCVNRNRLIVARLRGKKHK